MCGKLGNNEVETLENMMSMAVCFVIADTLDLDIDALEPDAHLSDLGMTEGKRIALDDAIQDMFNQFSVDFTRVSTVRDIVDQVAKVQLH